MRAAGANYMLFSPRERPFLKAPEGLVWVGDFSNWYLFSISTGSAPRVPSDVTEKLLGKSDIDGLMAINEVLVGDVGVTELFTYEWVVEGEGDNVFKWLGQGYYQGLRGFLWSEAEMPVVIDFHLTPGPSREDLERNLTVFHLPYGAYGSLIEKGFLNEFKITGSEVHSLFVNLKKGLNEFAIFTTDSATIPVLANGDVRPLLVSLNQIDVLPMASPSKIINFAASMQTSLRASEHYLAEWGVEAGDDSPFLWLGEGLQQGFRSIIWSEVDTTVKFVLKLEPGPSRDDFVRNLNATVSILDKLDDSEPQKYIVQFDGPIHYEMEVNLTKGFNVLELATLDQATIDVLPNGDTRPLLVQLQGIEILPLDD
jgi:hypothetical protein